MSQKSWSIFVWFRDLLYPPRCVSCRDFVNSIANPDGGNCNWQYLCQKCVDDWEKDCVDTGWHKLDNGLPYFALARYRENGTAWKIILRSKTSCVKRGVKFLAEELAYAFDHDIQHWQGERVITYIPRSKSARRTHGFDQSQQLALALGEKLGFPVLTTLSHHSGAQQKMLNAAQRTENARQAYRLDEKIAGEIIGRQVVLVDDVVTTGSSMMACAELLRQAGANGVICLAVARVDGK